MALKVVRAAAVAANTPFTVTVPGQERWVLLSVLATCSRVAGGSPNRAYTLAVSDGTRTVLTSPAGDAGTEPGTCTVTWTNGNPSTVASGASGFSLGPMAQVSLAPGYILTGTITSSAVGDQWTNAVAWVDYSPT